MAIKFPHAAFRWNTNTHMSTHTHTHTCTLNTKQQMCCEIAQLNALWMAAATPTKKKKVKQQQKSKSSFNFALNTWACGYANFSLVSWFSQPARLDLASATPPPYARLLRFFTNVRGDECAIF